MNLSELARAVIAAESDAGANNISSLCNINTSLYSVFNLKQGNVIYG